MELKTRLLRLRTESLCNERRRTQNLSRQILRESYQRRLGAGVAGPRTACNAWSNNFISSAFGYRLFSNFTTSSGISNSAATGPNLIRALNTAVRVDEYSNSLKKLGNAGRAASPKSPSNSTALSRK